jgi:hypothetical protein
MRILARGLPFLLTLLLVCTVCGQQTNDSSRSTLSTQRGLLSKNVEPPAPSEEPGSGDLTPARKCKNAGISFFLPGYISCIGDSTLCDDQGDYQFHFYRYGNSGNVYQFNCGRVVDDSAAKLICRLNATSQEILDGTNTLLRYERFYVTDGGMCGCTWDRVTCTDIVVCYGQSAAGCSSAGAPGLGSDGFDATKGTFTDFLGCDWAYAHPHNTDLAAAQQICIQNGSRGNGTVRAYHRVWSASGGTCGYTFVRASCDN